MGKRCLHGKNHKTTSCDEGHDWCMTCNPADETHDVTECPWCVLSVQADQ